MSVTVVSLSTSCLVKYAPKNWQGARWHSAARVTDSTARVTARSNAFPPELSSHARTHASLCLRGRIRVLASKHSCLVCVLTWFVCAVAGGSVLWRSEQSMRARACSLDACDRRMPHTALRKDARANKSQRRRDAKTQRRTYADTHRPTHTRVPGDQYGFCFLPLEYVSFFPSAALLRAVAPGARWKHLGALLRRRQHT